MKDSSKGGKAVITLCLLALLASSASASILIDSQDWTDVYSGMYQGYENWDRGEPYFVKNPSASNIMSGNIFPVSNVTIIQSNENAYSGNMESRLESAPGDFNIHEVIEVDSANIELVPEDQEDFIVVPSGYPEAAIVSVPLARVTDSWVLIAEEDNVDQISSVLDGAEGNVMMIGSFTRGVRDEVEQYADEEIISPNAHELSVEVAKRFREEQEFKNIVLSPGNSLSKTVFEEQKPVLITYNRAPSTPVVDYMNGEGSFIEGVLLESPQFSVVGNNLNDQVERDLVVMVKFGQARGDQNSIYAPSLYPLPGGNVNLLVESAVYEPSSGQIVVTYRNPTQVKVYELTSFNVRSEGEVVTEASDESPVLVGPDDTRTVSYEVNMTSTALNNDPVIAFSTSYGTNPDSLDKVLTNQGEFSQPYSMNLTTSNITDNSNITLNSVVYLEDVERFKAELENNGPVKSYATVSLREVSVRGQDTSYTSETVEIEQGEAETVYIAANPALDRIDIQENDEIRAVVSYGKKEDLRLKEINREVEFRTGGGIPVVGGFSSSTTAAVALVLIVLVAGVVAEVRYDKLSEVMDR
jgi:hypothetical protein